MITKADAPALCAGRVGRPGQAFGFDPFSIPAGAAPPHVRPAWADALSSPPHSMTNNLFNLSSSDGAETHSLSSDGWLVSYFSGITHRRWIPDLPDFLRSRGMLEPRFTLGIHRQPISAVLADVLGISHLHVLGNAKGIVSVALVTGPLHPDRCAAIFQAFPRLTAVAHASTLTLAPPPSKHASRPHPVGKSVPEFSGLRRCRPALQTVDTVEDNPWL